MEGQNETNSEDRCEPHQPDFAKQWNLSDVILAVEDEKFHVHRIMLARWSPVFEKMFTSDFKEKQLHEVPLLEKKASEIREMLLVMYVKAKPVTEDNVFFLLDLAQEYQMDQLRQLCEECLIGKTTKSEAIAFVVLAQKYGMDRLAVECITHGAHLPLREIHGHKNYGHLDTTFRLQLAERRVKVLESLVSQAQNHLNEAATNICGLEPIMEHHHGFGGGWTHLSQNRKASPDKALDWLKKNKAKPKPDYTTSHYHLHVAFEKLCTNFGLH